MTTNNQNSFNDIAPFMAHINTLRLELEEKSRLLENCNKNSELQKLKELDLDDVSHLQIYCRRVYDYYINTKPDDPSISSLKEISIYRLDEMSQFTSKKLSEVYVDVDINCVVIVYLMIEPTSVFKLPDLLMDYKEKIVIRERISKNKPCIYNMSSSTNQSVICKFTLVRDFVKCFTNMDEAADDAGVTLNTMRKACKSDAVIVEDIYGNILQIV